MTKKDYTAFAGMMKGFTSSIRPKSGDEGDIVFACTVEEIAFDMADIFAKDNPRFDREKFLKACGF